MDLGPQPDLRTPRLSLTPFLEADAEAVFAYASNPNVSRFTTWETHTSVADAERFIRWVRGREAEFCWAIRLSPGGEARGAIEFGLSDEATGAVHFVLAEELWNRGLMTEAVTAVVEWGFRTFERLERVTTGALSANIGSRRVLEKCGFELDGLVGERWAKFEEPVALASYTLTRGRWGAYADAARASGAA